jgi:oligopeptide/dipeptide ABC transporter ATP-binding protein
MYRGEIMEEAPAKDLNKNAFHPYTKLLFKSVHAREDVQENAEASMPPSGAGGAHKAMPQSEISAASMPCGGGCVFAHRCELADERCKNEKPQLALYGTAHNGAHKAACFKAGL